LTIEKLEANASVAIAAASRKTAKAGGSKQRNPPSLSIEIWQSAIPSIQREHS